MDYHERKQIGDKYEQIIGDWLEEEGYGVIYASRIGGMSAPAMRGKILPDILACRNGKSTWIEIKHYEKAVLNQTIGALVHGIPVKYLNDYYSVSSSSGLDAMVLVVEGNQVEAEILIISVRKILSNSIPCLCAGCRANQRCVLPEMKKQVYWLKNKMTKIGTIHGGKIRRMK